VSVKKDNARGTYFFIVDLPPVAGKRQQIRRRGFRLKQDAENAEADVVASLARGTFVRPTKGTVGAYLVEHWLPKKRLELRESTWHGYEKSVRKYVLPHLEDVQMAKLDASTLEGLYTYLRAEGGHEGRPLSAKTVRNVAGIMTKALKDAARLRLIAHNPASDTELPKAQRSEMRAWGAEDAESFLAATRGTRLYPLWRLALATGLRRGELCGHRWSDVDLVAGTASVAHTRTTAGKAITPQPKTDAGFRTISLDAGTVTVLRAWKKRQLEERMAAGPAWIESPYMFTHEDGQPPHPGWVTKRWNEAVVAAGVPPIRLHDARHSAASIMLRAMVPTKVVSERLGHANVGITLSVYAHITAQDDQAAADALGVALGEA
jgi:integrase